MRRKEARHAKRLFHHLKIRERSEDHSYLRGSPICYHFNCLYPKHLLRAAVPCPPEAPLAGLIVARCSVVVAGPRPAEAKRTWDVLARTAVLLESWLPRLCTGEMVVFLAPSSLRCSGTVVGRPATPLSAARRSREGP